MGLLKKLKSVFGAGSDEPSRSGGEADVTVEYEPDAESEHAVKGTDEASGGTDAQAAAEAGETTETAETAGSVTETEETAEAEADVETDEARDAGSPSVEEVKGIGPTYSGRLGEAGLGTVAELAAADPETVAEAAEVSVSRAEDWIERAHSRT